MMDTIPLRGIKFNFRNLRRYPDEGAEIIRYLKELKPILEEYLRDKEILPKMQDQLLGSDNYVFVLITQDIVEKPEGTLLGCIGSTRVTENLIIELRVIPNEKIKNFELLKTFVHEIFHLFFETEGEVRNRTDEFLEIYSNNIKRLKI